MNLVVKYFFNTHFIWGVISDYSHLAFG